MICKKCKKEEIREIIARSKDKYIPAFQLKLCFECRVKIVPNHIPEDQYSAYIVSYGNKHY